MENSMPEIILDLSWLMAFVFLALFTTYHRINLLISTIALSVLTYSYTFFWRWRPIMEFLALDYSWNFNCSKHYPIKTLKTN